MAEQLYYDAFNAKWFRAEEEKFMESIEKLNKELFNTGHLNLDDIYAKINEDLPEDMKIGVRPIWSDFCLEFDYLKFEENPDYKPITLGTIKNWDGLTGIKLEFNEPRYKLEDEDL